MSRRINILRAAVMALLIIAMCASAVYADVFQTEPLVLTGEHRIKNYDSLTTVNNAFVLTAKNGAPMPKDAENGTKRVVAQSNGSFDFGEIEITKQGTYEYTVSRDITDSKSLEQDDSVYNVRVAVFSDGSKVIIYEKEGSDAKADEIVYDDEYYAKITYNLNGGMLDGSTDDIEDYHLAGGTINLREAPAKKGYKFTYWKGSRYDAGAEYTVPVEGHTFTAQYKRNSSNVSDTVNRVIAKTGDNLQLYIIVGLIIVLLVAIAIVIKKRQNRK